MALLSLTCITLALKRNISILSTYHISIWRGHFQNIKRDRDSAWKWIENVFHEIILEVPNWTDIVNWSPLTNFATTFYTNKPENKDLLWCISFATSRICRSGLFTMYCAVFTDETGILIVRMFVLSRLLTKLLVRKLRDFVK